MPPRGVNSLRPPTAVVIAASLLILLFLSRSIAGLVIEFHWWHEIGQFPTLEHIIVYRYLPLLVATLVAFGLLWVAHARGLKSVGTGLGRHPLYAAGSTLVLLLLAVIIARASLDPWTVVSYLGSLRAGTPPDPWRDPYFGRSLQFYFFDLPLYSQLLNYVVAISLFSAAAYWIAARFFSIANMVQQGNGNTFVLTPGDLLGDTFSSRLFRGIIAALLLALAARVALHRYSYLFDQHRFLVGIDWIAANVRIPLLWLVITALVVAAFFVIAGRIRFLWLPLALLILPVVIPPIVSAVYVRPNELALQTPFIAHHIAATRAAWGLDKRLKEVQFPAKLEAPINAQRNRTQLDNVRLWDWRAFKDTVTQIQALRQYYVFNDTDVDRYVLGGNVRQVMLTPRELDIGQLPDAQGNWINGHFIYTHGYGLVMAETSRISPAGQPVLMVQDAPPKINTPDLKLTRPEIYYGEVTHEPVFVRSNQEEFNFPSGSENVRTRYEGKGGIPVGSFAMRLAAAIYYGDRNVLFTDIISPETRMILRRNVRERVRHVAGFIEWDHDPYLVVTKEGRLVWLIDGYTSSSNHPYSRRLMLREMGPRNYLRNSVKAAIDAYDGSMSFYVFEPDDPLIRAFGAMFPNLFQPASAMSADLRAHTRYPEVLFSSQAEIYRTFHMTDPEAFYNQEDLWDLAKHVAGQERAPEALPPAFVLATLPGETEPEYMLVQAFTPRSKDNLIGLMLARSDGEHLGEVVVLQLSKQSLIYGPLQIEARIDSDQVIAKDLSLWNQQGSQVLRGHTLVLPVEDTFVYIEPIYIQSAQAKMPQLRKVVVAMGNTLIYKDTYEEAIAELTGAAPPMQTSSEAPATSSGEAGQEAGAQPAVTPGAPPPAVPKPVVASVDQRLQTIRSHMRRYRELSSQGRWSEAGKELEALEKLAQ